MSWNYSKILLVSSFISLVLPLTLRAATNDFEVRFSIADLDPPTTPTNLIATPISDEQIDLTWDASSDNVAVAGYQISRDTTPIATTTLTTFSDTGLTASTTYSYVVRAFDAAFNYSTSSVSISTTTLEEIVVPTATSTPVDSISGSVASLRIVSLNATATEHSVSISFESSISSKAQVRWGRTTDYESGFLSSDTHRYEHRAHITDLLPGTTYEFEIIVHNERSGKEWRETVTVTTLSGVDTTPPANVQNFRADIFPSTVELSWDNPADSDFERVRVLSSDRFYPTHIADGWLVYDGSGESVVDIRQLNPGKGRYYTIFAIDAIGNVSSGVIAFTRQETAEGAGIEVVIQEPTSEGVIATTTPTFLFEDLEFRQGGFIRPITDHQVSLDAVRNTEISIAYELVPEHLKTIMVTMEHPDGHRGTFSFLLRINNDKTAYTAEIGPLGFTGDYKTTVTVYDYATRKLFSVFGTAVVSSKLVSEQSLFEIVLRLSSDTVVRFWWLWILVLLLALLYLHYSRLK